MVGPSDGLFVDEVHDEAERLEHAVSETFIERLDARLGHPTTDPHGDPIPTRELSLSYPETTLLCQVPAEVEVRVEQVDDSVPAALRVLDEQDVPIGAQVTVVASADGNVVISGPHGEQNVPIEHDVAHAVRVSVTAR